MRTVLFLVVACLLASCSSKSKKAQPEESILSNKELDFAVGVKGTPEKLAGTILQLKDKKNSADELLEMLDGEFLFKLNKPKKELLLLQDDSDELGYQHLTFARIHKGVEIWGDELKFHINDKNELYLFNGDYHPSLPKDVSISPTLTAKEAEEAAKQALALSYTNQDETKLYIFPAESEYRPAWRVIVAKARLAPDQWECLVDAETGEVLHKSSLMRTH